MHKFLSKWNILWAIIVIILVFNVNKTYRHINLSGFILADTQTKLRTHCGKKDILKLSKVILLSHIRREVNAFYGPETPSEVINDITLGIFNAQKKAFVSYKNQVTWGYNKECYAVKDHVWSDIMDNMSPGFIEVPLTDIRLPALEGLYPREQVMYSGQKPYSLIDGRIKDDFSGYHIAVPLNGTLRDVTFGIVSYSVNPQRVVSQQRLFQEVELNVNYVSGAGRTNRMAYYNIYDDSVPQEGDLFKGPIVLMSHISGALAVCQRKDEGGRDVDAVLIVEDDWVPPIGFKNRLSSIIQTLYNYGDWSLFTFFGLWRYSPRERAKSTSKLPRGEMLLNNGIGIGAHPRDWSSVAYLERCDVLKEVYDKYFSGPNGFVRQEETRSRMERDGNIHKEKTVFFHDWYTADHLVKYLFDLHFPILSVVEPVSHNTFIEYLSMYAEVAELIKDGTPVYDEAVLKDVRMIMKEKGIRIGQQKDERYISFHMRQASQSVIYGTIKSYIMMLLEDTYTDENDVSLAKFANEYNSNDTNNYQLNGNSPGGVLFFLAEECLLMHSRDVCLESEF